MLLVSCPSTALPPADEGPEKLRVPALGTANRKDGTSATGGAGPGRGVAATRAGICTYWASGGRSAWVLACTRSRPHSPALVWLDWLPSR